MESVVVAEATLTIIALVEVELLTIKGAMASCLCALVRIGRIVSRHLRMLDALHCLLCTAIGRRSSTEHLVQLLGDTYEGCTLAHLLEF